METSCEVLVRTAQEMNGLANLNEPGWLSGPEHVICEIIIKTSVIVQTGKPCCTTRRIALTK